MRRMRRYQNAFLSLELGTDRCVGVSSGSLSRDDAGYGVNGMVKTQPACDNGKLDRVHIFKDTHELVRQHQETK
jgi:hypothetical protein